MNLMINCKSAKIEPMSTEEVIITIFDFNPLSLFDNIKEETVMECYGLYSDKEYNDLKNAFKKYGYHTKDCRSLLEFEEIKGTMKMCDYKCTCGFKDLIDR